MTNQDHFGISGRLGAVATMLLSLACATSAGAALAPDYYSTMTWDASDASVTALDISSARQRAVEVALAQVRATRSILGAKDLLNDPAFREYLDDVGMALDTFDGSDRGPESMMSLATSLALSRASLEGHVRTLASWAALVRAASTQPERYVRIPDRFRAVDPFVVTRELPPSPEEMARIFEFDHIADA